MEGEGATKGCNECLFFRLEPEMPKSNSTSTTAVWSAAMTLDQCVRKYRGLGAPAELEVRVGRRSEDGTFVPGLPPEEFEQLLQEMRDTNMRDSGQWTEHVDYYYRVDGVGTVRTRVHYDSAAMAIRVEHTTKTRLHTVTLSSIHGHALRVSLSTEEPVAPEVVPQSCRPHLVRLQQRRSFADVREGGCVWRYEMSKVWTGDSRMDAERKQHLETPVYETECELVDGDEAARAYMRAHSDEHVGQSLVLKGKALLGVEATDDFVVV